MKVYSFKDIGGAMTHPLAGVFPFVGHVGLMKITITMSTEKTQHLVGADGTVCASYIAGDNGVVSLEVIQNSEIHRYLMNWYNLVKNAADAGDISNFLTASMTIINLLDGSRHIALGISIPKLPDKGYAAQASTLVWSLPSCLIYNQ